MKIIIFSDPVMYSALNSTQKCPNPELLCSVNMQIVFHLQCFEC